MIVPLALVLALVGCGGGSNATTINGNWNASLISTSGGQPVFSFTTTLTETGGSGLSITNFTITSNGGSCFVQDQTTQTGSFTLSGNFNGSVMGTFGMTVTGSQNVLTLQGGIGPNNTLTGNWRVTGSSCSGAGTFIFTRM
jgi:hypothetical protein